VPPSVSVRAAKIRFFRPYDDLFFDVLLAISPTIFGNITHKNENPQLAGVLRVVDFFCAQHTT